jgi:hypothetical protein
MTPPESWRELRGVCKEWNDALRDSTFMPFTKMRLRVKESRGFLAGCHVSDDVAAWMTARGATTPAGVARFLATARPFARRSPLSGASHLIALMIPIQYSTVLYCKVQYDSIGAVNAVPI